jgi:hypothetical protein
MPAFKVPEGVTGVGVLGVTYAVTDGILVLPDGVEAALGDDFEPAPLPKGAKPTVVTPPEDAKASRARKADDAESAEPPAEEAPGPEIDGASA